MSDTLPPPPGSAPRLAAGEIHENDVLKRGSGFSWNNFGGEGFLVSLAVHTLLVVVGLGYVIHSVTAPPPRPADPIFENGPSGKKGATTLSTRPKPAAPAMALPTRVIAKGTSSAITLAATPAPTPGFAGDLAAGKLGDLGAKFGSATGPAGPGGPGGAMKHLTTIFGSKLLNAPGLTGTFYDCKQTPAGGATKYTGIKGAEANGNLPENATAANAFVDEVLAPFIRTWDPGKLAAKFFTAPEKLVASQIFIPACGAGSAPEAYGVGDKVKGSRWLAHYKGAVLAPKSGKFRFWGLGDDVMVVRWEGKNTLDSGWTRVSLPGRPNLNNPKVVLGMTAVKKGNPGAPFRASRWIEVTRGREYPIEILISEVPGGLFGGWLMMEEWDESKKDGDGKIFLFRMSDEALPEGLADDTGLGVDLAGKNLVWTTKRAPADRIRR